MIAIKNIINASRTKRRTYNLGESAKQSLALFIVGDIENVYKIINPNKLNGKPKEYKFIIY